MGVGVAGLQAIATARRLGAVVTATDVRPADQGAGREPGRQVHRRRGRGVQAGRDRRRLRQGDVEPSTRPSRPSWSPSHIEKQDIVITTALIPGRPAPKLVSAEQVGIDEAGLGDRRPGGGAGRQLSRATSRARSSSTDGVTIVGMPNLRGRRSPPTPRPLRPQPVRLRRACCSTRRASSPIDWTTRS